MKYLLKQKSNFLLYCIVMILSNLPLYAQLTQRVITITRPSIDIPGLAKTIAAQTGVEYSLNMQNTSLKKDVHLKPGKWKLEDVMTEVQRQVGLEYKILGDHILFTDYKPGKKTDMVQVVPPKPRKVLPSPRKALRTAVVKIPESIPTYILNLIHADDYTTPPPLAVKPWHVTIRELKDSAGSTKEATPEASPEKERRHIVLPRGWASPLAEAGLTANDIVYLSASVKAGIQYFYGIATLGVSSRGMRFRYGAGIRIPLNEYSALHAEFTTGALSRKSIDTVPQGGLLHERLNSYGVSWSKTIRPRLNLQLEVNYSTLKKSNDSTVNKVNMETNYFGYGTPVYNAKIGSNGKYDELYTWIGVRVSLFYHLRRK